MPEPPDELFQNSQQADAHQPTAAPIGPPQTVRIMSSSLWSLSPGCGEGMTYDDAASWPLCNYCVAYISVYHVQLSTGPVGTSKRTGSVMKQNVGGWVSSHQVGFLKHAAETTSGPSLRRPGHLTINEPALQRGGLQIAATLLSVLGTIPGERLLGAL